jgi:hypothetical protein
MKPGKTFNLSKETKRTLALMPTDRRNAWKKCMIEAELYEAVVPKTTKRERPGQAYTQTAHGATPTAE